MAPQFSSPEVGNHWAEIRVLAGLCSLRGSRGQSLPLPLPAPGDGWPSLASSCITPVSASPHVGCFSFVCIKCPPASLLEGYMWWHVGPTQTIQGTLCISGSLIYSHLWRPSFLNKVTYTDSRYEDPISVGPPFNPLHYSFTGNLSVSHV